MMIQIKTDNQTQETIRRLGAMGQAIGEAIARGLVEAGLVAAGNVVANELSGQALKMKTGSLSKAMTSWPISRDVVMIGIPDQSGVDHYKYLLGDETVTIRAKKAKYLTIPIGESLTRDAKTARQKSPRDYPEGFFVRSNNQLLFGYKNGQKGKFRPLFVLKKSVTVKGTGALKRGVENSMDMMTEEISSEIVRSVEGAERA